jgi:hypothetical protein
MSILPAIVAGTALRDIPDVSARNRRRLTGIYSENDEADATVFKYYEKTKTTKLNAVALYYKRETMGRYLLRQKRLLLAK